MTQPNKFTLYQRFPDRERASELISVLKQQKIDFKLIDNRPPLDLTFSNNTLQNEVQILVKQADFEKLNAVLNEQAAKLIDQVDSSHYLYDFSNEELYDILLKHDEWSALDFQIAQKLLLERGQPINSALIESLTKKRLEDLAQPEQGQQVWIVSGYIFALLGGLIGTTIGWYLWRFKKTLPNGQKVHGYSTSDRTHGLIIFIFGILSTLFWFIHNYSENYFLNSL